MKFNIVRNGDDVNVTVVLNGGMFVADEQHPNIEAILAKVKAEDENGLVDLFDASHRAGAKFEALSDSGRVTVANSRVYVDGDEVDGPFADRIVAFLDSDNEQDWQALVNFLEKCYTNVEKHTRDNLARWLDATGGFTIHADGDIIGYKGLRKDGTSVHSGPGVVDGKPMNTNLPNKVGSVLEMARSAVQHDPRVGCSTGLHVGTFAYAKGFSSATLARVKFNPRDVVSVPTDCSDQKLRVCRYEVLEYVDKENKALVEVPADVEFAEDYVDGYVDGYEDAEDGVPSKF